MNVAGHGRPLLMMNRVVLEMGIYASHLIWRIRYRQLRIEAKACGKSIDEMLDARNGSEESEHLVDGLLD